jgi:hypothetical protein
MHMLGAWYRVKGEGMVSSPDSSHFYMLVLLLLMVMMMMVRGWR